MKIHISHTTKILLEKKKYKIVERGTIEVKGKGEMKTYFVDCKLDDDGKSIELSFLEAYEEYALLREKDKENKINFDETKKEIHDKNLRYGFKEMDKVNQENINSNESKNKIETNKIYSDNGLKKQVSNHYSTNNKGN
jgi:hypothetical protein